VAACDNDSGELIKEGQRTFRAAHFAQGLTTVEEGLDRTRVLEIGILEGRRGRVSVAWGMKAGSTALMQVRGRV